MPCDSNMSQSQKQEYQSINGLKLATRCTCLYLLAALIYKGFLLRHYKITLI